MADPVGRIKAHVPSVLLGIVAGLIFAGVLNMLWGLLAALVYAIWWLRIGGKNVMLRSVHPYFLLPPHHPPFH